MDVHFSSKTDLWETPAHLFQTVADIYHPTLDVCALPTNAKCDRYFTPEQDGLSQEWEGVCWMNPPYGREIGKWVKKAREASLIGGATVIALLPSRTDTAWWHDYIWDEARGTWRVGVKGNHLRGRLKFGAATTGAPFPSALIVFEPYQDTPETSDLLEEELEGIWG